MTSPLADDSPPVPTVDRSVLESLLGRLGESSRPLLVALLEAWEDETARRLEDLRAAAATGDPEGVASAAHGIRGGSASIGVAALAQVCGRVEEGIRGGEPVDLAQAHADVAAAVQQARIGLAQLRDGSSG